MNSIGKIFTLTTFGESHGKAIGGVIDGVPAGFHISEQQINEDLSRRRPGNINFTSARREDDKVELLSGLNKDGITLGSPIGFIIRNTDAKSEDYDSYIGKFRPHHADFTYFKKYGITPQPGGGRSSARETACRVVAGSVAKMILRESGITASAYISAIGNISIPHTYVSLPNPNITPENLFCPNLKTLADMKLLLEETAKEGDSIGGRVSCILSGVPAGVGEPVYDKFQARLAEAMMSINAAKAFEYGPGVNAAQLKGSQMMESFGLDAESVPIIKETMSGGIAGGITQGSDIEFSVTFKPTPTLAIPVKSINTQGVPCIISPKGRHDSCVAIRAVPVVEAMAYIVTLDMMRLEGLITCKR